MVSVDTAIPNKFGWNLPCSSLAGRLARATRGRVLRSDQDFPDQPEGVTAGEWAAFRKSVRVDKDSLFIDYHLKG
jgi:hypothetical protein